MLDCHINGKYPHSNWEFTVITSKNDDPILMDSEGYNPSSFEGLTFNQDWRRKNDIHEASLYGESYINPYKRELKEFYDD